MAQSERSYWLWVANPAKQYYDHLDPGSTVTDGWWTTHRDTKAGDLALVYFTMPAGSIHYFCEALSDAGPDEWDGAPTWSCEYTTHVRFENPLDLPTMREDSLLENEFKAMRGYFRRRVYRVDPLSWNRLTDILKRSNPRSKHIITDLSRRRRPASGLLEKDIEELLAKNLGALRKAGWHLNSNCERQVRVGNGRGRIDLLCRDRKGWVVIELKLGRATSEAVGQTLKYVSWVRESRALKSESVRGLVVARGEDEAFAAARSLPEVAQTLSYVDYADIADELGL